MNQVELDRDLERRRKAREYLNAYRAAHPELIRAQRERRRARIMELVANPPPDYVAPNRLEYYRAYNIARQEQRKAYNELRKELRAAAGAKPRAAKGA